jgi:hypothetical protein
VANERQRLTQHNRGTGVTQASTHRSTRYTSPSIKHTTANIIAMTARLRLKYGEDEPGGSGAGAMGLAAGGGLAESMVAWCVGLLYCVQTGLRDVWVAVAERGGCETHARAMQATPVVAGGRHHGCACASPSCGVDEAAQAFGAFLQMLGCTTTSHQHPSHHCLLLCCSAAACSSLPRCSQPWSCTSRRACRGPECQGG